MLEGEEQEGSELVLNPCCGDPVRQRRLGTEPGSVPESGPNLECQPFLFPELNASFPMSGNQSPESPVLPWLTKRGQILCRAGKRVLGRESSEEPKEPKFWVLGTYGILEVPAPNCGNH